MKLKQLSLANFKNYQEAKLAFNKRIIGFTGLNGAGKTNLLDAIFYASTGKSYFNTIDSQNILKKENYFTIEAVFEKQNKTSDVFCAFAKGQKKKLKLDQVVYEKLADHYGKFPVVLVSPMDLSLITDGNEERRKFIDSTISIYNHNYLLHLVEYNKVMAQRNQLLRNYIESRQLNLELLNIYSSQLEHLANQIFSQRKAFISSFNPVFQKMIDSINNQNEQVSFSYQSEIENQSLSSLFTKNLEREKQLGRTEYGTHKDKIIFEIEGQALKKFGSQGQQKSFLFALKLAQAFFIKQQTNIQPILLLDDIFDRLDDERAFNLMKLVNTDFNQVFITDTSKERLENALRKLNVEAQIFEVIKGSVQ